MHGQKNIKLCVKEYCVCSAALKNTLTDLARTAVYTFCLLPADNQILGCEQLWFHVASN